MLHICKLQKQQMQWKNYEHFQLQIGGPLNLLELCYLYNLISNLKDFYQNF